jgi:hypothetical protein
MGSQTRIRPLVLFLFLCAAGLAFCEERSICESPASSRGKRFEIGLRYQSLIPSGLPDFTTTLPVLGPVLGMPLLGGTLQVQGVWGGNGVTGLSLYLVETNYRRELMTPFFHAFVLVGAHYLHYGYPGGTTLDGPGVNAGIGLAFAMGEGFELSGALKAYLQNRTLLSFGGGFSFLL